MEPSTPAAQPGDAKTAADAPAQPGLLGKATSILGELTGDFAAAITSGNAYVVPSSGAECFYIKPLWGQTAPREVVDACIKLGINIAEAMAFPDDALVWLVKGTDTQHRWGLYSARIPTADCEGELKPECEAAVAVELLTHLGVHPEDIDAVVQDMIERGTLAPQVQFGHALPSDDDVRRKFEPVVYRNPSSWSTWQDIDPSYFVKLGATRFKHYAFRPSSWAASAQADLRSVVLRERTDPEAIVSPPKDALQAVWVGHSSLLLQVSGATLLVDPVWSKRLSVVARDTEVPFALETLKTVDAVLITHNHDDHLDLATVQTLKHLFNPLFLVPHGLAMWFRDNDLTNVVELKWWEDLVVGNDTSVTFVPAQHWSNRGMLDINESLWGGWVIKSVSPAISVYVSGDTGYCPAFAEIGLKHGPFDLSFLPIGPLEPRALLAPANASPEEAIKIHRDVRSRRSVPVHWGTFSLGTDLPGEPARVLEKMRNEYELSAEEFSPVPIGKPIVVHQFQEQIVSDAGTAVEVSADAPAAQ